MSCLDEKARCIGNQRAVATKGENVKFPISPTKKPKKMSEVTVERVKKL
jgi:hypothetical protein